jgi:hypothetical protein
MSAAPVRFKPRKDKRARATGRLGTVSGERYAVLPLEVLTADAFKALPDYAVRVLVAHAAAFHGHNNGAVTVTAQQAKDYGIRKRDLYAGQRILESVGLLSRTRQGHLSGGIRIPNLFALTWRGINEAPPGKAYDPGIGPCPTPSHDWARWKQPDDWRDTLAAIKRRARGETGSKRTKSAVTPQAGHGRTPQAGPETPNKPVSGHHRRVRKGRVPDTTGGSPLRIREGLPVIEQQPSAGERVRKLLTATPELSDFDVARILKIDPAEVSNLRSVAS